MTGTRTITYSVLLHRKKMHGYRDACRSVPRQRFLNRDAGQDIARMLPSGKTAWYAIVATARFIPAIPFCIARMNDRNARCREKRKDG
jgi:hypothetical protein